MFKVTEANTNNSLIEPFSKVVEQRIGQRFEAHFPVQAQWTEEPLGEELCGRLITIDGNTENIGPSGARVHLDELPVVGSRIKLLIHEISSKIIEVEASVVRVDRNPGHPVAAVSVLFDLDEWKDVVWDAARIKATSIKP